MPDFPVFGITNISDVHPQSPFINTPFQRCVSRFGLFVNRFSTVFRCLRMLPNLPTPGTALNIFCELCLAGAEDFFVERITV
jgi:hypothetical protein